jgi:hypothetical protein
MSFSELIQSSTLTDTQVESLVLYANVLSGKMKLKDAASKRSKGPVSVGAFWRVVQQGRTNVKKSIVTMILASWLGIVKTDELRRLMELTALRGQTIDVAAAEQAQSLVLGLVERIVM